VCDAKGCETGKAELSGDFAAVLIQSVKQRIFPSVPLGHHLEHYMDNAYSFIQMGMFY